MMSVAPGSGWSGRWKESAQGMVTPGRTVVREFVVILGSRMWLGFPGTESSGGRMRLGCPAVGGRVQAGSPDTVSYGRDLVGMVRVGFLDTGGY